MKEGYLIHVIRKSKCNQISYSILKSQNPDKTKCGEDRGPGELTLTGTKSGKWSSHFGRQFEVSFTGLTSKSVPKTLPTEF